MNPGQTCPKDGRQADAINNESSQSGRGVGHGEQFGQRCFWAAEGAEIR